MIAFHPVEPDLTPERVDARLAAGWFPYGQYWMTCRMWPEDGGIPQDTVWVRVRLELREPGTRHRKIAREGLTVEWHDQPLFDAEHQALYDRFCVTHPSWRPGPVRGLLLHDHPVGGPLFHRTREASIHDRAGRLLAFRWFLEGGSAIAGVTSVYDPDVSGLGGIARWLVDQNAARQGLTWSYPGYVRPGAAEPWTYKIKAGRSEWLDPDAVYWRPWDGDPPQPDELVTTELHRRLSPLGRVELYPRWAAPWFDHSNRELPSPYYVVKAIDGDRRRVIVWDILQVQLRELIVEPGLTEDGFATWERVGA